MGSPVVPLNKMNFKFLLAVFVVAVALVPTPTEADRPRIPGSLASLDLEQIFSSPEPLRNRTSAITGYMRANCSKPYQTRDLLSTRIATKVVELETFVAFHQQGKEPSSEEGNLAL